MPRKTTYILIATIFLLAMAAVLVWYFFYRAVPALPEFSHMTLQDKLAVLSHAHQKTH